MRQNLVPNPSFENFDTLPCSANWGGGGCPINWNTPSQGSPDYFNHYSNQLPYYGVPLNSIGFQYAKSGVAYAGIFAYEVDIQSQLPAREYLQVELIDTLIAAKKYCVSFYVSLADNTTNHDAIKLIAISEMGIYFSNNVVTANNWLPLPYTPQVKSDSGVYLSDTVNWMQITGTYTAVGGERFITIGNFKGNNTDTVTIVNNIYSPTAYYYIDDVSVIKCNVGVDEITDDIKVSIFPNPSNGMFEVKSEKYKIQRVEVFNVLGEKIYNEEIKNITTATVNLQAPPGVYFVQVQTEEGVMRKKVVKE